MKTQFVVGFFVGTLALSVAQAIEVANLDGSNNNLANPNWGQAGTAYSRVAGTNYADGVGSQTAGPNARYISNRIFNDLFENVFDENNVTQIASQWGQFIDHTIGLAQGGGGSAPIPFNNGAPDPLESFTNSFGTISFSRDAATPGTGTSAANPRQQTNTVSSYIDMSAVYGDSYSRLEWLREGPVDGDLSNNGAKLLMRVGIDGNQYLPRANDPSRAGNPAPSMQINGHLMGQPQNATVAGDARANENIALTSMQTLMALEHNRIVDQLNATAAGAALTEELKFQIARKLTTASQQAVTYNEYLPSLGVQLDSYTGYKSNVNAAISNEFATVGYRAHSMIHGEFEMAFDADHFSPAQLAAFEAQGILVKHEGDEVEIAVPLNVAYFNPDLVEELGVGHVLLGLASEAQYNNDEMIDNQLRSLMFQIPNPGYVPGTLDGPASIPFFNAVMDLAAIDIQRGRDHGIASYNDLREAYGLERLDSFTAITGETSEELPDGLTIDDPAILAFLNAPLPDGATDAERVSTLAARLKAIYGDVDSIDAFVGMVAEEHVPGTSFGELQFAMWKKQFEDLRDGDRFFYLADGYQDDLAWIFENFGLSPLLTFRDILLANTDLDPSEVPLNLFVIPEPATIVLALGGLVMLARRTRIA